MASRYTKYDLERVSDYLEFESFCHTLMSRVGYDNIDPLGGFSDKGRDAIHVSKSSGEITIFAYSVREDWNKKLNEDLEKIHKHGHRCDRVVFVTTASLTAGEKDRSKDSAREDFRWNLEIYDLERIATLIDGPHPDLIRMHPGIFVLSARTPIPSPSTVQFIAGDLPADFVPRPSEHEQIVSRLLDRDGPKSVAITALRGAGGYGKSTLALAVCHDQRVKDRFSDGILWVTLGERPGDLNEKVFNLIIALTGERPSFTDINLAVKRLTELLSERSILLVIDDVWDSAHLRPFIQRGGAPRSVRLITTRNRDTLPPECGSEDLDAMTPQQAVELLGNRLEDGEAPDQRQALARLSALVGEWPLLLTLVKSALVRRAGMQPLPEAIDHIATLLEKKGIVAFDNTTSEGRDQSVAKTLEVSVDFLSEREQERFLELAVFPEDTDVPLQTVHLLWGATGGLDYLDTDLLCDKLKGLSLLLKFDPGRKEIRLHDVIRKYLIGRQGTNLPRLHAVLLDAYPPAGVIPPAAAGESGWADLPPDEPYMWDQLAYHLIEAGRSEELVQTVKDLWCLTAKVHARNALAAEQDLVRAEACAREDPALRALRRAFIQCGHLFNRLLAVQDIAATLHSRVWHIEVLRPLAQKLAARLKRPYLAPSHPLPDLPHPALIRTLTGHSGWVNGCSISRDRKRAVSASGDKTVKVWDLESGREMFTLTGHSDRVNGCAISVDGKQALSASNDQTVKVWDLESGRELFALTGHSSGVLGCAISRDGRRAVSASSDRTVKVWDLESGRELFTLAGHSSAVWGCAISGDGKRAVSASRDQTVKVWDLESGRDLFTLTGHSSVVRGCAISGDGKRAVSASRDHTVKVWDLESGRALFTLTGHPLFVNACAMSGDGKRAVSASADKTVRVWDLERGELLLTLTGHSDSVRGCAISDDGKRAVSASYDQTVKVWDLESGQEPLSLNGHSASVLACAISRDGIRAVSASSDKTVKVWDVESGRELFSLTGHSSAVLGCAISGNGKRAVSASSGRTVKMWDLESGRELFTLNGHSASVHGCAMSWDGKRAVSASYDRTVNVWDLESGQALFTLTGHSDCVGGCAISEDGKRAVSASYDRTVKVWDLESGRDLFTLAGHSRSVNGCAITGDRRRAVSASGDQTVRVWDLESGRELFTLIGHSSGVRGCGISGDGKQAVSVSLDQTVKVWDLENGECLATLAVDGSLNASAMSPDGIQIVAAGPRGVYFLKLVT